MVDNQIGTISFSNDRMLPGGKRYHCSLHGNLDNSSFCRKCSINRRNAYSNNLLNRTRLSNRIRNNTDVNLPINIRRNFSYTNDFITNFRNRSSNNINSNITQGSDNIDSNDFYFRNRETYVNTNNNNINQIRNSSNNQINNINELENFHNLIESMHNRLNEITENQNINQVPTTIIINNQESIDQNIINEINTEVSVEQNNTVENDLLDNFSDDSENEYQLTETYINPTYSNIDDSSDSNDLGVNREILNLTSRVFINELRYNECVICKNNFECEDLIRTLPCKHQFHINCIDRWLQNNNKCPICKKKIE